jgi:hypothetical protein
MKRNTLFFACLLFALSPMYIIAQNYDNASQSAYSDGWSTGDNGGEGFDSWTLNTSGSSGHFLGSSDLDFSWGFWANSGGVSEAIRPFYYEPAVLDTIVVEMDNSDVQTGGTVGFALRNGSDQNLIEIYFIGGESNYKVNELNEIHSTLGHTLNGLKIEIVILSGSTCSVKLSYLGNSSTSTISGTFLNSGPVDHIRFFNANAGPGSSHDLFFNNIEHNLLVLPLQWLSFSAEKHDQQVALSWSYEGSEVDKFIVERGGDEQSFSPLSGEIMGDLELRSNTMHFADHSPMAGVNYYRIKAVDQNGGISYSTLRKVRMQKDEQVLFYPNPVRDYITIPAALESLSMIKIFDLSGKLCYQNKFLGKTNTQVDLSSLENGEYNLLFLFENGRKESRSLFKVK